MTNKDNQIVIGFVGTGVMGKGIITNLLKAKYTVEIYTRTKSKADTLIEIGAKWNASVAELASKSDIIISIVGYPNDVEQVYFADMGILNHVREGTVIIDMTTSKPNLAEAIYERAKEKNVYAMDAPVSGGDIGAQEGKLSIMVGGDLATFEKVKPIFEVMGQNIQFQGEAGAGQYTKMCNQIALATNMIGVCEAMRYAEKAGLQQVQVLKSIQTGAAGSWALTNLAPKMNNNDFNPGFYIKHFIKDMEIAIDSAEEMGLDTPGLSLAKSLYDKLEANGDGDLGTQALFKLFG
ncbi:NAD(P)-dependent oxidoreductase [Aquibacillus albus]|uniref:3-hydroxyisobutyrate dehydrogenase n=1 Tax=Aquibacillus albus TaxID=1168171 RepID=A0ABS2MWB0_9BACI|nr:NAD(P)-dependent oxidoreductase [Aquibacillus albus]MBM7570149.1 3-hydroxyisobutyrate dehydrogenase [Aquibacillus albus]